MKSLTRLTFILIALIFLSIACKKDPDPPVIEEKEYGSTIDTTLHISGLEGNLLGDSPDRQVLIYLPPGYEDDQSVRYPVVYFLHGYTQTPVDWWEYLVATMDGLLDKKEIDPMIIVSPNAKNYYGGSWYSNSEISGQWEDFIVVDVVSFMDQNYRTIASADSRGISGHSMGGYGAIKLAMKYPDLFCAVYALSPAMTSFNHGVLNMWRDYLMEVVNLDLEGFDDLPWKPRAILAMAGAFSPNPDSQPFYCDFPVTKDGAVIDTTWRKWLDNDLYSMIPIYKDNLLNLRAIQMDCGTLDTEGIGLLEYLREKLNANNVEYDYLEYGGNHTNKIPDRIVRYMVPFFSEVLNHE